MLFDMLGKVIIEKRKECVEMGQERGIRQPGAEPRSESGFST
jgi:hypothetical protein